MMNPEPVPFSGYTPKKQSCVYTVEVMITVASRDDL